MLSPAHIWSDAARVLLGLALTVSLLLAGSWRLSSFTASAVLMSLSFVVFAGARMVAGRPIRLPLLSVVLVGLAAATCVQAFDLGEFAEVLSPESARLRRQLGAQPGFVSYEVSATWREAAKYMVYAMAAVVAFGLSQRRSLRHVLVAVPVAIAISALVATLHRAFGLQTLFGMIPHRAADSIGITTLPNVNHAAGLANLGALTALGLGASWKGARARWALYLTGGALALVSVLQASFGGLVGLAVGAALYALLARRSLRPSWELAPAAALPVVGALLAYSHLSTEFAEHGGRAQIDAKLEGILSAWPLVLDHARFGVGRGAFASVFTRYRSSDVQLTYAFPENIFVQLTSEWGLALGSVALVGLLLAVIVRMRAAERNDARAALAGVTALLAQNFVDFSLEIPAVALAVAVILGATTPHRGRARRRLRLVGLARLGAPLMLVSSMGLLLAASYDSGDLDEDVERLQGMVEGVRRGEAVDLAAVEQMSERHPSNATVQLQTGYLSTFSSTPDPSMGLRSVNRALLVAPREARVALLAARVLVRAGYKRQGLEEVRRAWALDGGTSELIRAAAELSSSAREFLHTVPRRDVPMDIVDERSLARAVRMLRASHPEWSPNLVAAFPPPSEIPKSALSAVAAAARVAGALDVAEAVIEQELSVGPAHPDTLVTRAHIAVRRGHWEEAWAALERLPESNRNASSALELRFRVAVARKDTEGAEKTLRTMKRVLPMSREQEAKLAALRCDLELSQGDTAGAVRALDAALVWTPTDLELHLKRAVLLEKLGRSGDAQLEVQYILRRAPRDRRALAIQKRLERLHKTTESP